MTTKSQITTPAHPKSCGVGTQENTGGNSLTEKVSSQEQSQDMDLTKTCKSHKSSNDLRKEEGYGSASGAALINQSNEKVCLNNEESIFDNLKYICDSTDLIVQSLQKGLDVVQMKDGEIILTEVKTVNTVYNWDKTRNKLVKISHN